MSWAADDKVADPALVGKEAMDRACGDGKWCAGFRLGLLVPGFPSQTHTLFWREVQALEELGVDVKLLSTRRPAAGECPHPFMDEAARRTHYVFPPRPGAALATMVRSIGGVGRAIGYVATLPDSGLKGKLKATGYGLCAGGLARECRKTGIQHIHVHSCAEAAHVAAICRLLGGPSYSLHLHGDLPVYGVDHQWKMRDASFISADARPMQQQVIEQVGVPAERTYTIWMGVDTRRFVPADGGMADGTLRVLTVARLNRCKGHLHALAAVRKAIDCGIKLSYSIAGTGPHEAEVAEEIRRLKLEEQVRLLGGCGEEQVLELLQSADVFVLASVGIGEASPVAVMEAMSCGLPVIASIIGGTPDMIQHDVNGLLVRQGDEIGLSEALVRLALEPGERDRLGQAARLAAVEKFDCRMTARRLLEAIGRHVRR